MKSTSVMFSTRTSWEFISVATGSSNTAPSGALSKSMSHDVVEAENYELRDGSFDVEALVVKAIVSCIDSKSNPMHAFPEVRTLLPRLMLSQSEVDGVFLKEVPLLTLTMKIYGDWLMLSSIPPRPLLENFFIR